MKLTLTTNDSLSEVFSKISPSDELIHILLSDGEHKGLLHERIFYNLPNPLVIESESGNAEKCALRSENCEAYHKDTENRAVLTFGEKCTSVTLKNFTLENTHVKTCDDAALGNQAEAICFHCPSGKLSCEGMSFVSRQDTIHVKGFSRFKNCFVCGDVDFIWGYCDTSVFEDCTIHTRADNRGSDRPAYVLQSRALNSKPGFVFINCNFTAEDRGKDAEIYIGRSQGTGKKDSVDRWDSIALINCTISELYDLALWTDENGTRAVYPEKGSAKCGWRQYGTKIRGVDGSLSDYDSRLQEKHGYTMTEDEAKELAALI
ncbi:pectinesterase family protein [uncultured Treponema sp.]|uniref:pectinesterase family protein n=1 Tax=uncultured Treponema sp. TaxID=162155 RepID=UPI0025EEBC30|nr:pectinesterase family protein [uncultured Treponema sp.]